MNKKIFASMMACSNMGQSIDHRTLTNMVRTYNEPVALEDCINALCGPFMESDEHERVYYAEGQSWLKHLEPLPDNEIERLHPQLYKLYTKASMN